MDSYTVAWTDGQSEHVLTVEGFEAVVNVDRTAKHLFKGGKLTAIIVAARRAPWRADVRRDALADRRAPQARA